MNHTFVGIGFGPIQAGLFLYEAFRSGNFSRLVVADVLPDLVNAIRSGGGRYHVNIADREGVRVETVDGVEIFNPAVAGDRDHLIADLAAATEICTALPSVEFFDHGGASVAVLLAQAFARKLADDRLPAAVVYAAENHNHAAELLEQAVRRHLGAAGDRLAGRVQFLNTVIGKMSGVVSEPEQIHRARLACMTDGANRAFRLEAFNRILISRITLPGFRRGIEVFVEKPDLLPFEEAKLYGHNAVHALIGYLAQERGLRTMHQAGLDPALMAMAREAFLEESGPALIARHAGVDPLFTPDGFRLYAEDLLERMVNPWLEDAVARVTRDARRKLGWDDRLVGTMRMALDAGVTPHRFARAAAAALRQLSRETNTPPDALFESLWPVVSSSAPRCVEIEKLIRGAGGAPRTGP